MTPISQSETVYLEKDLLSRSHGRKEAVDVVTGRVAIASRAQDVVQIQSFRCAGSVQQKCLIVEIKMSLVQIVKFVCKRDRSLLQAVMFGVVVPGLETPMTCMHGSFEH
jgi:hypothetical protein